MTELDRILSLSRGPAPAVPDLALSPDAPALRPAQVDALAEFVRALGATTAFGPPGGAYLLGCGSGKTLVALLLPALAERVLDRPVRTLHLVPAALVDQTIADATRWARTYAVPGTGTGLRGTWSLRSHEGLSAPSGRRALFEDAPDLLVVDECHAFANPDSGRWRRVSEYLRARPETRVVVLSGTLTWRSLRQARHLLLAALRGWCPLPADRSLEHWASVIDVGSEPCADDHRAVAPLVAWAGPSGVWPADGSATPAGRARLAYRARLLSCPGVVLTSDVEAPVSLLLRRWVPSTPAPESIRSAVEGLEKRWELPDGTELVSALEIARHGATLPLGIYLRWRPETVDPTWLARRRAWGSAVRALVAYQGVRFQTPGAVEAAARAGRLDARTMATWAAWAEVADLLGPETETVVLEGADNHIARILIAAGAEAPIGNTLVWTSTPAVGEMVARVLGPLVGGACRYHGAGSSAPTGGPAVASIRVWGRGWDGAPRAGYRRALILEPPSSAATYEQLLARHHRTGAVDDVIVDIFAPTLHGLKVIRSGFAGARYIEETTGARQRLLLADWVGVDRATCGQLSEGVHEGTFEEEALDGETEG